VPLPEEISVLIRTVVILHLLLVRPFSSGKILLFELVIDFMFDLTMLRKDRKDLNPEELLMKLPQRMRPQKLSSIIKEIPLNTSDITSSEIAVELESFISGDRFRYIATRIAKCLNLESSSITSSCEGFSFFFSFNRKRMLPLLSRSSKVCSFFRQSKTPIIAFSDLFISSGITFEPLASFLIISSTLQYCLNELVIDDDSKLRRRMKCQTVIDFMFDLTMLKKDRKDLNPEELLMKLPQRMRPQKLSSIIKEIPLNTSDITSSEMAVELG
jgi:hypothetical protein